MVLNAMIVARVMVGDLLAVVAAGRWEKRWSVSCWRLTLAVALLESKRRGS